MAKQECINQSETDRYDRFRLFDRQSRRGNTVRKFLDPINNGLCINPIPTGFPQLDAILGGGFTPGLICLGALSGIGKTTMTMQAASQIAKSGRPVIVFSLEMSAEMLVAKEISRQTFLRSLNPGLAKEANQLVNFSVLNAMSNEEWNIVRDAVSATSGVWDRISIIDSKLAADDRITVEFIATYVHDYLQCYPDLKPVVIVDYLQILPAPTRLQAAQERQVIDANVAGLRNVAVKLELPVIMISALNRENYNTSISFNSFKGSGGIEYSCDTVIGLQMAGVGEESFNADEAKRKNPREVELKILKQRFGRVGDTIRYKYFANYNHFEEQNEMHPYDRPGRTNYVTC